MVLSNTVPFISKVANDFMLVVVTLDPHLVTLTTCTITSNSTSTYVHSSILMNICKHSTKAPTQDTQMQHEY